MRYSLQPSKTFGYSDLSVIRRSRNLTSLLKHTLAFFICNARGYFNT